MAKVVNVSKKVATQKLVKADVKPTTTKPVESYKVLSESQRRQLPKFRLLLIGIALLVKKGKKSFTADEVLESCNEVRKVGESESKTFKSYLNNLDVTKLKSKAIMNDSTLKPFVSCVAKDDEGNFKFNAEFKDKILEAASIAIEKASLAK